MHLIQGNHQSFRLSVLLLTELIIPTIQPTDIIIDFNDHPALESLGEVHDPRTCNELAVRILTQPRATAELLERTNSSAKIGDSTCDFNWDASLLLDNPTLLRQIELRSGIDFENVTWSCKLENSSQICDGVSECQTDECHCHGNDSDVFYCADGSGCVAWKSLCNSIADCSDRSDECLCSGFIHIPSSSSIIGSELCLSENEYCLYEKDGQLQRLEKELNYFPHSSNSGRCNETLNPISSCLNKVWDNFKSIIYAIKFGEVSKYCQANCNLTDGWQRFCPNVGVRFDELSQYEFRCDGQDFSEAYGIDKICDGVKNCNNHKDEIGCPGRFYCNPNETAEWVGPEKLCDYVKDCVNGIDECATCQFEELSSSEFLIKSKVILTITIVLGFLIILMNLREGYKCWIKKNDSKVKSIDKMFILQIFFHDILMGVYLCGIVLASIVLKIKGDYCLLEEKWRAGPICSVLGVLFSFASHGSLLAIACISITRYLTCHSLVVNIKKRVVTICSVLITFTNVFHSVLPLLPVTKIRDIFRTGIFFTNLDKNPFFSRNPINRSRLTEVYRGMFHKEEDLYQMLNDLTNVTSKRDIFDVIEVSYYGNTGLCVPNIFKSQESYKVYKILYCVALLVLLVIISTAYIKIILKQRKSNKAVVPGAAGQQQPVEKNSMTAILTIKVTLMIGTQLTSWISFISTVLYFQFIAKAPTAPPKVFEVFALVVIPITSLLNPIFYSELYKKVVNAVWRKWRQLVTFLRPMKQQNSELNDVQTN